MKPFHLILSLFLVFASIARSQDEATPTTPGEGDKKSPPGNVRAWAMIYEEKAPISIRAKVKDLSKDILLSPGDKPQKGSYIQIPNGDVEITLLSGETPVQSEKIKLTPDNYQTLLITRKNGNLSMEVLQDPSPGIKDFPPTIRLFNFGSPRTAEIKVGNAPVVQIPPNSYLITPLASKGVVPVNVNLPDPSGGFPATSLTEVDTAMSPCWSVVTIPDYRGKLRPRVSEDGKQ